MGEFVPLFRTQSTNFDLNYRFHLDSLNCLRSSLNYNKITGDDGRLDYGARIGFDRNIKYFKKFSVYTGIDINLNYQFYDIDNRSIRSIGPSFFLGFKYQPTHFLSISTEPGFYWFNKLAKDPESFSDKRTAWNEFNISNLGQLLLSFHF